MADITFSRFAGINNVLPPERIRSLPTQDNAACELAAAVNVDIDDSGQLSRRAGTVLKLAGAAHSLWSNGDRCLFAQADRLLLLRADFTTATIAAGLAADQPISYASVADNIYWSNGTHSGALIGTKSGPWGMQVPAVPGVAPIAGSLTAGAYQVVMTWRRDTGEESGTGIAASVTLTDSGGVRVTWDVPTDPGIVDALIYLTEPNGSTLYQALVAPAANGTADITSAQLSLPCNTQWLEAPPAGQCLAYHRGRIYIASGAFLYATTPLGYGLCDLRDYLAVDSSTIRFLAGVEHGLFVGTEKAVYFLAGDQLEELALTVAVDAPAIARSAVNAEGVIVTGDQAMTGQQVAVFATGLGIYVGTEDGSVINLSAGRYRFDASASGAALFRNDPTLKQYLLFLDQGAATTPGVVINTHARAVTTYAGLAFNSLAEFNGAFLAATAAGIVSLEGDTDQGQPIVAQVAGGVSDLSEAKMKRVLSAYAGYRAGGDLELTMVNDGQSVAIYRLEPRRLDEPHASRVKLGRGAVGRYWQWKLANRDGADFAMDALSLEVATLGRMVR